MEVALLEILSKDDARSIFGMARADWVENVRRAVMAGQAEATGSAESGGVTMHTPTQTGFLSVGPDYSAEDRPAFIQVTVVFRSPTAEHLEDSALEDAIELAKRQMKPEYEVMGHVDRLEGAVALFFMIMEAD